MISLEQACKIAKEIFIAECNCDNILQILDANYCWIISCGAKEEIEMDTFALIINKNDGSVKDFILPSDEGFELLNSAKEIEIPKL